ncbi:GNAT family N-acetyltransferase [Sediminitomix flava]|uniref:Acetyltransferase (GNAT) family protein n=1 Tax=Sediminitomix flava TaxID=379075 RepID=A0A315ZDU8_SEDFL|nr:GNAT family N-acetyltransferase [Sediminitomix flava]PWJ43745.1 acetyltransferase (GNAT) family protein [Sediminitomix flava]
MTTQTHIIRNAKEEEFATIGKLMVNVYSNLEGFPKADEQPQYYEMLTNIGEITKKPFTELIVAVSKKGKVDGAVVYFSDMTSYGSGGSATQERNASGFRLLAVSENVRGLGLGKKLSLACIEKAKNIGHQKVVIHSTEYMKKAWRMYENLGFGRAEDLDFKQESLPVFGFRLFL